MSFVFLFFSLCGLCFGMLFLFVCFRLCVCVVVVVLFFGQLAGLFLLNLSKLEYFIQVPDPTPHPPKRRRHNQRRRSRGMQCSRFNWPDCDPIFSILCSYSLGFTTANLICNGVRFGLHVPEPNQICAVVCTYKSGVLSVRTKAVISTVSCGTICSCLLIVIMDSMSHRGGTSLVTLAERARARMCVCVCVCVCVCARAPARVCVCLRMNGAVGKRQRAYCFKISYYWQTRLKIILNYYGITSEGSS